jgi:hypothetical protein
MTDIAERPCWRDAEDAAARLQQHPGERRLLLLLARLPLLPEGVMERLAGFRGGASVYRDLRRLADAGLLATIRPPVRPGPAPRLWYLTDLGLAALGLDQGVDAEHLAHRNRLRGVDLLALLPGLPQLLATYELLAALAASRPGPPNLLAWERPWRRRYQRPTAKAARTAALPAYAALAWESEAGAYLLLPDQVTVPLAHYRATLGDLFTLRGLRHGDIPALLVATSDGRRAAAWLALLEEVRRGRAEAPFTACIATWDGLRAGLEVLARQAGEGGQLAERLVQRVRLRPGRRVRRASALPRLVGDALVYPATRPHVDDGLGRVALGLSAADRALLDLVGRHPFLTLDRLATVLGWPREAVRRRWGRLLDQGLMRLLAPGELGKAAAGAELVELTAAGLALVAAQQGLPLGAAIRANGLAGGGPERPLGARRKLTLQLAHTLGADDIFVRLVATARSLAVAGGDDALVEWRGAAGCSHRHVRPDGYGIYRHGGRLYGFFLEYDRGTMSARDYRKKFAAYHTYWTSRRFERDYDGFPTILVVAVNDAAEKRIAAVAGAAAIGRPAGLPVLLTSEWRISGDPTNPHGLLGAVWREPDAEFHCRREWVPGTASTPLDGTGGGAKHNGPTLGRQVGRAPAHHLPVPKLTAR